MRGWCIERIVDEAVMIGSTGEEESGMGAVSSGRFRYHERKQSCYSECH